MTVETLHLVIALALMLAVFAGFIWERLPADVVAMLALMILLASGVLSSSEALSVFANPGPITVAAMFVLSAALERTGVIDRMGDIISRAAKLSPLQATLALLAGAMLLSAFINNTPVVVILTPVAIALARTVKILPSRLLIPLSYAAIFGGTMTLIGTSTNLLVDGVARDHGMAPFGMFEITPVGLIFGLIGALYLAFFGRWLLPDRETLATLIDTRQGRKFITEVVIADGSPLIGKTPLSAGFDGPLRARIIDVIRDGLSLRSNLAHVVMAAGDRLVLRSQAANLLGLATSEDVHFDQRSGVGLSPVGSAEVTIMEGIVGPHSSFVGRAVSDLNLRRLYGVYTLALHRREENLREDFNNLTLQFGDSLLLEGPVRGLRELFDRGDLINLSEPSERPFRRTKAPLALGIIMAVMLLGAFEVLPIAALALTGATLVIALGCLEADDAYRAIEWRILMLIFGMLGLGMALEKTGAAQMLAGQVLSLSGFLGPIAMLSLVYLITSLLTELISNNATAILLTPIAIAIAHQLGLDARPFVIAVMFAASASFATPIGYQTNTFVFGAGGYRFTDFLRIGLPLNILFWIAATFLIPLFWPL